MGSASVECQQGCNKTADVTRQNADTGKGDQHCAQSKRNRQSAEKVAGSQEYGLKAKEIYRNAIIHWMVRHLQAIKKSVKQAGQKRNDTGVITAGQNDISLTAVHMDRTIVRIAKR